MLQRLISRLCLGGPGKTTQAPAPDTTPRTLASAAQTTREPAPAAADTLHYGSAQYNALRAHNGCALVAAREEKLSGSDHVQQAIDTAIDRMHALHTESRGLLQRAHSAPDEVDARMAFGLETDIETLADEAFEICENFKERGAHALGEVTRLENALAEVVTLGSQVERARNASGANAPGQRVVGSFQDWLGERVTRQSKALLTARVDAFKLADTVESLIEGRSAIVMATMELRELLHPEEAFDLPAAGAQHAGGFMADDWAHNA